MSSILTKGIYFVTYRLFTLRNSHIRNVSSNLRDSALLYIDIHAHHNHGASQQTVEKQIEQYNLLFEDIDQTVIELFATSIVRSENVTCKFIFSSHSQKFSQSHECDRECFSSLCRFSL